MKKILFVTHNSGKLVEIKNFLEPLGFSVENINLELTEIQASQEEVARAKALEARKTIAGDLVVEDTGFYIDAYNGFPGVLAAPVITQIKPHGLLNLMNGVTNRKAHFKSIATYLPANSTEPLLFAGECSGEIGIVETAFRPHLPYDAFFIPDGETKTLGEMSIEEKNKYSHRVKAFEKLASYLKNEGKK
ncbi:MAG: non-canonical purine NTP pyrophosphatase [Candidatus Micrarchaeota archaeon]|nr:non-canonical purine NTP pyrophosphatase [Candidatus Micrarchaeota archaeon]